VIPKGTASGSLFFSGALVCLTAELIDWQFTDLVRFGAGDRYHVTIADPGGVTIATKEVTAVSYDTYEPNGPSCGPTCHRAHFP
jgi:hypothetical protein